jgi:putative membrane protein
VNTLTRSAAFVVVLMSLGGASSLGVASSVDPMKASGPSTISNDDIEFFGKAAQTGMTEVQAAAIASTRASGADTKSFASTMATDHAANNEQLKALALRKGVTLPTQLDKTHQSMLDELQKGDPKKFDASYAKDMTTGHKGAIDLFEKTSKDSKDLDIRDFATSTLPTLQHHLEMATHLSKKS